MSSRSTHQEKTKNGSVGHTTEYGQLVDPQQFTDDRKVTLLCQEGKMQLSGTITDRSNAKHGPHFILLQPPASGETIPKRIRCIFYGRINTSEFRLAVNVNKKILTVTGVRF